MLKVSKLADYATVIMHWLSQQEEQYSSVSEISVQLGFAATTISKILKLLSDAHLVDSKKGACGGYKLSRPADQVTLVQIIAAIDGQPALTACSQAHSGCRYDKFCGLRSNWQSINTMIYSLLDQLTLYDMNTQLAISKEIPLRFYSVKLKNLEHTHYAGDS